MRTITNQTENPDYVTSGLESENDIFILVANSVILCQDIYCGMGGRLASEFENYCEALTTFAEAYIEDFEATYEAFQDDHNDGDHRRHIAIYDAIDELITMLNGIETHRDEFARTECRLLEKVRKAFPNASFFMDELTLTFTTVSDLIEIEY